MKSYLQTITDGWIALPSGARFNVYDPDPELISVEDIGTNLGGQCRYSGGTIHHYSVAEHAVLVSRVLELIGHRPIVQLCGLHHDDPEAFGLPDVAGPVKRGLHGYNLIEAGVMRASALRFALPWPFPREVQWVDVAIRQLERAALPAGMLAAWPAEDVPDLRDIFGQLKIEFWPRDRAKFEFIHRHAALMAARTASAPADVVGA